LPALSKGQAIISGAVVNTPLLRRETPSQQGRILTEEDIAHYQRVVVALQETMRLMEE